MKRLLVTLIWIIASGSSCFASHTVTDETGRTVSVPDHPHRIICLVPSITDTVFALGGGNDVVAVSDYVKYPAEAMKKPSVGSISNPSTETILASHPDLVLGMPHQNQPAILEQLQGFGIPLYIVDPHGLAGILHSVGTLGQATGRDPQAKALASQLQQRIDAVRARTHSLPIVNVYMPISYDPVITIGKGSFITEIIEAAGGHSITSDIGQEWPHISMEAVIARAPEALLMMRGGTVTVDALEKRPGWNVLPAVKSRRVFMPTSGSSSQARSLSMHWRTSPDNFILELIRERHLTTTTSSRVSGSAVQIRHYPVTVSAERHAGTSTPLKRKLWEGSMDR